jgi:Domain of Unknown Function (DUF1080)
MSHEIVRRAPLASKQSFPQKRRRLSTLAVGLFVAFCAFKAQAAVLSSDDFESGVNSNFTPDNDSSRWSVDATSETGNAFYKRATSSTSWSDAASNNSYGDVAVQANVRIDNWNASTQNRAYLFARFNGSTPDSASAYQASIAPDSTISIERRGANKAITTLATAHSMDIVGGAWNAGTWNLIRLEVSGSSPTKLAMYVNGVQVATATDYTAGYSSGAVGFGSAGASVAIDDVSILDTAGFSGPESGESAELLSTAADRPMVCALPASASSERTL